MDSSVETTKYDYDNPINEDTTIYAKWMLADHEITEVKIAFDKKYITHIKIYKIFFEKLKIKSSYYWF